MWCWKTRLSARAIAAFWWKRWDPSRKSSSGATKMTVRCSSKFHDDNGKTNRLIISLFRLASSWKRICFRFSSESWSRSADRLSASNCCRLSTFCSKTFETKRHCVSRILKIRNWFYVDYIFLSADLDYLLSNNHVNCIIVHKFDFSDEEVMAYYISFLKTMSLKLNIHTIHFFFNEVILNFNSMNRR